MAARNDDTTLDAILALQIAIAWAGEGRSQPRRLGWWETDLVDSAGGGDLLARLLPRTHAWASLEAVREAARRVDAKARPTVGNADHMRTLFFLGFELDEELDDRLASLKRAGRAPSDVLDLGLSLDEPFSRQKLAVAIRAHGSTKHTLVPGGRQVAGPPPSQPDEMVRRLVAALEPLPEVDRYPMPFFRLDG